MSSWYNLSWNEVVKKLNSNVNIGLNNSKVEILQSEKGKNIIDMPKTKSNISIFFEQLKQIWIFLLICAIVMFFYTNHIYIGILLSVIVFSNLGILTFINYRHERSFLEFEKLQSKSSLVIRNGKEILIDSKEIVVGDIVLLQKGDIVPADLRIIQNDSLKVKEGAVTGIGDTTEKYSTKIEDKEIPLNEMKNILFKSSVIIDGTATGIVIATGKNTKIANSINMMFQEKDEKYLFQYRLKGLLNRFSLYGILIVILMGILNYILGKNKDNILFNVASLFTAFIPETMFIIMTISVQIIINVFNKKGITFKNISSIENLSNTSIVCQDKVGVFSKKEAYVEKIYVNNVILDYSEINIDDKSENSHSIKRMTNIGLLCNDTKMINNELKNPKEDFYEIGIVYFAKNQGMRKKNLELKCKRVTTIPFDTDRRIMTTINKIDGNYRANVKGTVEGLLSKCTHILKNGIEKEITEDDIRKIKNADISMSCEELSAIAFAYRNFNYEPSIKENIESNLVFVGLMGFYNPRNLDINELLRENEVMHIKPIIITEENKLTAEAFGKNVGIFGKTKKVLSGVEIDNMPDDEFERIIEKVSIFSRISSKHKAKIAKYYKKHGHFSVMTGKRISDLPYLKTSNIGICIGKSNIVKKFSDIILENTDFRTILNIIKSSRKLVSTIYNAVLYIVSCSTAQMIYMLMGLLNGKNTLLTPGEILFTNGIVVTVGCISIIMNYNNEKTDYVPDSIDKNFLKDNKGGIIFKGFIIALISYIILYTNSYLSNDLNRLIAYLVLNLNITIYSINFCGEYVFKNKISNISMAINILMQIVIIVALNFKGTYNLFNVKLFKNCLIGIFVWILFVYINKKIKIYNEDVI